MKGLTEGMVIDVLIETVEGQEYWIPAVVEDLLASQFTVIDEEDNTLFRFYADEGDTWRKI